MVYADEIDESMVQRGGLKYGIAKMKKEEKGMKKRTSCLPSLMTDWNNPILLYMFSANYILLLIIILQWAVDEEDNQVINMVIICFFDVVTDGFAIFPSWNRR